MFMSVVMAVACRGRRTWSSMLGRPLKVRWPLEGPIVGCNRRSAVGRSRPLWDGKRGVSVARYITVSGHCGQLAGQLPAGHWPMVSSGVGLF